MPKPKHGVSGSGMHINMSLSKDGVNIFDNEEDKLGLSQEAYYFIGGIMKHMKGMTVITNPIVNSYKRFVPGYEAPIYITWSATNRSPLIRIPAARGEGRRVELRNPDPSANPYLVLALCLAAGIDGIKNSHNSSQDHTAYSEPVYLSSQNRIKRDSELNHFLLIYMRRLSALSQMILSARYWVNISTTNI